MRFIIAPHVDDEVLGCSSILDDSEPRFVYYCGIEHWHEISLEARLIEVQKVAIYFNFDWEFNKESKPNYYDVKDFVNPFEKLINVMKPDEIFIPYPSYNQDHKQIYHAAMVALRPHDRNHFVKKIFVYEETDCLWENGAYEVNYFVPLDIQRKLTAYSLHESQVREHRSFEHIRAMATLRGSMIGIPYAESFIIKRWVN